MHKSKTLPLNSIFKDIILSVSGESSIKEGRIPSTQKYTIARRLGRIFCLKLSVEKSVEGYGVK